MTFRIFTDEAFVAVLAETAGDIGAAAARLGVSTGYARTVRRRLGIPGLGRVINPLSCRAQRSRAGMDVKPRTVRMERICMSCRKPFASEGSHNRLCGRWKHGDSAQMLEEC